jgi:hypothetical protein
VPATVAVTIQRSGSSTLTIPNLIASASIANSYLGGNNSTASATGTVGLSADHRTVTVTLGAVSTTGSGAGTGSGSVTLKPATSLNDFSGNAVDGATSAVLARLF